MIEYSQRPQRRTAMGCLLEFFLELIFELVVYCYIKLMQLIVPDKVISEKTTGIIKTTVTAIAALLAIVLIIGAILLIQDDPDIKNVGKYMTYIPLTIIGAQILLGIAVRIVCHFKK